MISCKIWQSGQINGFLVARAAEIEPEIPIYFVVWCSWKFWSWILLFCSLLYQFVGSFFCAFVLSIFGLDANWFIDFLTRVLVNRFNGLATFFLSLIYKNPWSRYLCQFRISKLVQASRTRLIRWFNGGSNDTALLPLLLLKIKSFRMLDTIVCSEPLVWLFSLAWDAVILTLDVGFICPFVVIDPTD